MARAKYTQLNQSLLAWLAQQEVPVTTASAIEALGLSEEEPAAQRHISRLFTRLEDRGALRCTLHGTTRSCEVVPEMLPETLSRARTAPPRPATESKPSHPPAIPASCSEEFLAAGGQVERLPADWDTPTSPQGKRPLGAALFRDPFMGTD